MQLNQNQQHFNEASDLLSSSDPDEFLINKFSLIIQQNQHQFQLCKMYLYHLQLKKQIADTKQEIENIKEIIKQSPQCLTPKKLVKDQVSFEKPSQNLLSNENSNKHKRIRRTANEIRRHFQCPVDTCKKQYGSEGSLNQHIKLKHEFLIKNYNSWAFQSKQQQKSQQ